MLLLSDLLLHLRKGAVALNQRWNTRSLRRLLILVILIVVLFALLVLSAYFTPMANVG
jgi:hypothetical protein